MSFYSFPGAGGPPAARRPPHCFVVLNDHFNVYHGFETMWLPNSGDDEDDEGRPAHPPFGYIPHMEEDDSDGEEQGEEHISVLNDSDNEYDEEDSWDAEDSEITEDSEDYDDDDFQSITSQDSGYESESSFEETPENSRPSSPWDTPESPNVWAWNPSFPPPVNREPNVGHLAFPEELSSSSPMGGGEPLCAPHHVAPSRRRRPEEAFGETGESGDGAQKRQCSESRDHDEGPSSSTSRRGSPRKRNCDDSGGTEGSGPKRPRWSDMDSD